MHQAFYRKWRPQIFDDVCGQEHITSILRYETENRTLNHAYLFCGSRGTGKTTCAKILAKAVNCLSPVNGNPCGCCTSCQAIDSGATTDVLEMDAASNNSVENVRDIRDEVMYSPASLRYRVYIIDEVHMLSGSAFNALLKTLEEPPEHVIFILATTELQKLPATIISRCQRFDFRRISTEALVSRLEYIAKEEKITLEPAAARMLAKLAQGGMRDAISLLELCAGSRRDVTVQTVEEAVGLSGREAMLKTVNAIADRDYDLLFSQIAEVVRSSKDIAIFWQDLIALYRDMLVLKTTRNAASYLDLTEAEMEQITTAAARFRKERLLYHCRLLEDALYAMQKSNVVKRIVAEMTLVRLCDETLDTSPEGLAARIATLEEQLATGAAVKIAASTAKDSKTKAEPTPVREATTPSSKSEPKNDSCVESKTEAAAQKRILRPVRSWMEVAERIGRADPMMASFVRASRAYSTEEGAIVVQFDNEFGKSMMDKADARDRLRGALSSVLRREVTDCELKIELVDKNESPSVIDEILEASEQD